MISCVSRLLCCHDQLSNQRGLATVNLSRVTNSLVQGGLSLMLNNIAQGCNRFFSVLC